jgi:hypothetical protein
MPALPDKTGRAKQNNHAEITFWENPKYESSLAISNQEAFAGMK